MKRLLFRLNVVYATVVIYTYVIFDSITDTINNVFKSGGSK